MKNLSLDNLTKFGSELIKKANDEPRTDVIFQTFFMDNSPMFELGMWASGQVLKIPFKVYAIIRGNVVVGCNVAVWVDETFIANVSCNCFDINLNDSVSTISYGAAPTFYTPDLKPYLKNKESAVIKFVVAASYGQETISRTFSRTYTGDTFTSFPGGTTLTVDGNLNDEENPLEVLENSFHSVSIVTPGDEFDRYDRLAYVLKCIDGNKRVVANANNGTSNGFRIRMHNSNEDYEYNYKLYVVPRAWTEVFGDDADALISALSEDEYLSFDLKIKGVAMASLMVETINGDDRFDGICVDKDKDVRVKLLAKSSAGEVSTKIGSIYYSAVVNGSSHAVYASSKDLEENCITLPRNAVKHNSTHYLYVNNGSATSLRKSVSFTLQQYNVKPVSFIIDQRGVITDPEDMVSERFNIDETGNKMFTDKDWDLLAYLRKRTWRYYGGFYTDADGAKKMQLQRLSRTSNDGMVYDVAYDYPGSKNADTWVKLGDDVYYRADADIPDGSTRANANYVRITFALEIPEGEDDGRWNKWDRNTLVGSYKGFIKDSKLYSAYLAIPSTQYPSNCRTVARMRDTAFSVVNYSVHKFFALLFYGYYGTLNCQEECGYGTTTTGKHYKRSGLTRGMTDTTATTGTGDEDPDEALIAQGYGAGIKSVSFWGLENWWGDVEEVLGDCVLFWAYTSNDDDLTANHLATKLKNGESVDVTFNNGEDYRFTSLEEFKETFNSDDMFVAVSDNINDNSRRYIEIGSGVKMEKNNISRIILGKHVDVFPSATANETNDIKFCDSFTRWVRNSSFTDVTRGGGSNGSSGGINCLNAKVNVTSQCGCRLMYKGSDETIEIVEWLK